jgi:hypothetical protein
MEKESLYMLKILAHHGKVSRLMPKVMVHENEF